jgi:hypothetical protein
MSKKKILILFLRSFKYFFLSIFPLRLLYRCLSCQNHPFLELWASTFNYWFSTLNLAWIAMSRFLSLKSRLAPSISLHLTTSSFMISLFMTLLAFQQFPLISKISWFLNFSFPPSFLAFYSLLYFFLFKN